MGAGCPTATEEWTMVSFKKIHGTAAKRCGGDAALAERMPDLTAVTDLRTLPDDRYFSLMSFRVFSAGLKHSMVEAKWPDFEDVFFAFDPPVVRAIRDEDLEALMNERRIIRHWGKIKATRANAAALCEIKDEYGGFGNWLADWPADDPVGLWDAIAKRFNQRGGMSGPYFLRMVGKDTFVLTKDVVKALNAFGVHDGDPKGKRARRRSSTPSTRGPQTRANP
jgi:3-methyladenine DNA glycosylase Tag